jgi:hypothetical protein
VLANLLIAVHTDNENVGQRLGLTNGVVVTLRKRAMRQKGTEDCERPIVHGSRNDPIECLLAAPLLLLTECMMSKHPSMYVRIGFFFGAAGSVVSPLAPATMGDPCGLGSDVDCVNVALYAAATAGVYCCESTCLNAARVASTKYSGTISAAASAPNDAVVCLAASHSAALNAAVSVVRKVVCE